MKKIAIIGAGTAGLAAAVRLQYLGYDVSIFEKNSKIGGRMYQIEEQGFKFDVGPTIVMMKEIYEDVFLDTDVDVNEYLQFTRLDPMFKLVFPDQEVMYATNDLISLIKTNEKFNESESLGYLKYLTDVYEKYLIAKNDFILKSFRKPTDFYNLKTLRQAYKLKTLSNAYSSISKFVDNDKLKQSLAFQTLYIGISPYSGPSIYTIIPMIQLFYGVYYLNGGMYSMAKAMEKRFLELGGKIYLNHEVKDFIIDSKMIKGINVNNQVVEVDKVVCNVDFPYAMKHFIKENKNKRKFTDKRINKMLYSSSSFVLYLGLKKKYQTEVHNIYFPKDFKKNVDDLFEDRLPNDPSFYIYFPSQIDETLAPEGCESLYILVPVPNIKESKHHWSTKETNKYKEFMLDEISKKDDYLDIRENIVFEKVFTPKDFKEKFNLENGATFGLRPTLKQSNYFRPRNKSRYIKNLYFAGSSNHPGAGVPIVLISAKLAVNEILKDDHNESK